MNFSDITSAQMRDPMRRVAILAHSLSAADQAWLYSQIPAAQLAHLQTLVSELVQLGIPADRQLLSQALQHSPSAGTREPTARAATASNDIEYFSNLDQRHVSALTTVLRHEPAILITRLMLIQRWSWKQQLLDSLPVLLRRQVEDSMSDALNGTEGILSSMALQQSVLRAIRLRCEQQVALMPKPAANVPPPTAARLVKPWVSGWIARRRGLQA